MVASDWSNQFQINDIRPIVAVNLRNGQRSNPPQIFRQTRQYKSGNQKAIQKRNRKIIIKIV